jgi:hypothetical protein
MWFPDRAAGVIALGAGVVAAVGLAVTIWYVMPRAAGPDGPAATPTLTFTSPVAPVISTFGAVADTYVQADTATTNYGASRQFVVDHSPERRSLLKFAVTGLTGRVTRAVLRMHTVSGNTGSTSGGTWRAMTDTTWSETSVTWNDQPEIDGGPLGILGSVTSTTWYEVDVTRLVEGDGTYSIAGTSTDTDGAYFDTRETGANGPQLVVTTIA